MIDTISIEYVFYCANRDQFLVREFSGPMAYLMIVVLDLCEFTGLVYLGTL